MWQSSGWRSSKCGDGRAQMRRRTCLPPKKTSARELGRHKRLYRLGWQDDNWLAGESPQALRPVRLKISSVQVIAEMPSFEAYSLTPAASRLATRVQGSPHLVDA